MAVTENPESVMAVKTCTGCSLELLLTRFSVRRASKDGLQPRCKTCDDAKHAEYYAEHLDEITAYKARYYAERHDTARASQARYYAADPERVLARSAASRAVRHGAIIGFIPLDIKKRLARLFGQQCMAPGCEKTDRLQLDHVIPLSKKGAHTVENFQLLCESCNQAKRDHLEADYRPAGVSLESLSV